ncbi:hypothetical protein, partial [Vibrio sp. V29_P1S30P107]|nr:hypothetical protein [Vibrio sp. V29_P1S30P107]
MFDSIFYWLHTSIGSLFSIIAIMIGTVLLIASLRSERKKQLWQDFHYHEQKKVKSTWVDQLSRLLNSLFSSDKQQVQQKFLAAGFYNPKLATYFMPIKYTLLLL